MIQAPSVVGLVLCEKLDVDIVGRRLSLIGLFHSRRVATFPSPRQQFTVYAALSDAVGEGRMRLEIHSLGGAGLVYAYERWFAAPSDRLLVLHLEIPVRRCVFPAPGR